ncbi:hypothetical protein F4861DRAFT_535292 [Xylaria intraflava]|nr:hypothetical protein F4861DRAFT_535292 [Xylaria intraflava]
MPHYDYMSFVSAYADTGSFGPDLGKYWTAIIAWLAQAWADIAAWLSQPRQSPRYTIPVLPGPLYLIQSQMLTHSRIGSKDVYAVILAWAITFTVVMFVVLSLGFGPLGVGAGTLAAAFQSYMYGGFTPAGGIFATLTSLVMLGALMPPLVILAAIIATLVAVLVWVGGAGR